MKKAVYITVAVLMVVLSLAALVGCGRGTVSGTGTVKYVDLEGGFYGIVGDDSQQYEPMNLDQTYQKDGLLVHFQARIRQDIASIHMWGTIVEITSIETSRTGTVEFVELEGGFYGIVGDDGKRYDPINLDPAYQKDGLRVSFQAKIRQDMASIHMWGKIIELTKIEILE